MFLSDLPLGDELQGDYLAAAFPAALVHFTERALSDRVEHVILIHYAFLYFEFKCIN